MDIRRDLIVTKVNMNGLNVSISHITSVTENYMWQDSRVYVVTGKLRLSELGIVKASGN